MPIPEDKKFFLELPIYDKVRIEESECERLFNLAFSEKQIDSFCIHCGKTSVFHSAPSYPTRFNDYGQEFPINKFALFTKYLGGLSYFQSKLTFIQFECTRQSQHVMFFVITVDNNSLIKIGQYPSLADLSNQELIKYRKILNDEKFRELNRGIGLTTHGVGIGAFVYLRRVFEGLIFNTYNDSSTKGTIDLETFTKLRMEDKIETLKGDLPEFLVRNKIMYGILSKGIHELGEQECLDIFPALRLGIELILDEQLERELKQEKIKHAEKAISTIQNKLRKS